MPNQLTELAVKAAKAPPAGSMTLWDGAVRGFGCRVSPKGRKSFIVLVASGRRKTIGHYPVLSIADARSEAKRVLADVVLGRDFSRGVSVAEAKKLFLADSEKRNRPRTAKDYRRLLDRHLATIEGKQLKDVSTRQIASIIDKLADTPSEAAHALAAIRIFFNWCTVRTYRNDNPTGKLSVAKNGSRDRILSEKELRAVFRAARACPYPFGTIVQLCILLGQRRSEIGLLEWSWIKDDRIVFPASVMKNRREHQLPLGELAKAVIAGIPRRHKAFVFPAAQDRQPGKHLRTVNGWSNLKRAFDKTLPPEVGHFCLHDLRRTYTSSMGMLQIRLEVCEKLIGHVTGKLGGIVGVYQRYDFWKEMVEAVAKYDAYIERLIADELVQA